MKLTKSQRAIILVTLIWEIIAYNCCYNNFAKRLNFSDFIIASLPFIVYWSIVWIWGFGTLSKIIKKIFASNKKNSLKELYSKIFDNNNYIAQIKKESSSAENNSIEKGHKSSVVWVILWWILFFIMFSGHNKISHANHSSIYELGEFFGLFICPFLIILLLKFLIFLFNFFSKTFLRSIIGIAMVLSVLFAITYTLSHTKKEMDLKPDIYQSEDTQALNFLEDYGTYYGIFVWYKNYCHKVGYDLKYTDALRKKYENEINKIVETASQYKIKGIHINKVFEREDFLSGYEENIRNSFQTAKKIMIISKLTNRDRIKAQKYLSMEDSDFFNKYGNIISDKEVCKGWDESLLDTNNPINNLFLKYR